MTYPDDLPCGCGYYAARQPSQPLRGEVLHFWCHQHRRLFAGDATSAGWADTAGGHLSPEQRSLAIALGWEPAS